VCSSDLALAGVPWRFINESRKEEGREPIPQLEGKIIMATPQGALDISDVPTVREFMEMQQKKSEPAPGVDSNTHKMLEEIIRTLGQRDPHITVTTPPVNIERGAIDVRVENLVPAQIPAEAPVVNVSNNMPETPVVVSHRMVKETRFLYDDDGRVIGKVESNVEMSDDASGE